MSRWYTVVETEEGFNSNTSDEAIDSHLDAVDPPWPSSLTALAYENVDAKAYVPNIVEHVVEALDEELQDPNGDSGFEGMTPEIEAAREALVKAILAQYTVWMCERDPSGDVTVKTAEWVRAHNPHWLDQPEIAAEVARLESEEA